VKLKESIDLDEAKRMVPIIADVDILVVGGGTAGSVAGIASARNGADTLIVEQMGFLGGTATAGLVYPMMPNHIRGKPLCAGISSEIQDRLAKADEGGKDFWGNDGWFNPEALKYVLEDMAVANGCRLLYHTFASTPILKSDAVRGVIIETKEGRRAVLSKITIDATGDADIAIKAGVPFESGRKEDGLCQPMSLRFMVGNIDLKRFAAFMTKIDPEREYRLPWLECWMVPGRKDPLEAVFEGAIDDGVLERDDASYFQGFAAPGRPGEMGFNCPRIIGNLKGHSALDLTEAEVQGRKRILRYMRFFRKYLEGFENAYLSQTAALVGVRESRRILGEYVLTAEDYFQRRKFDDAVARNRYPIDIHLPQGGTQLSKPFEEDEYHEIPYRCLVPLGVEDLLVAGRCLSATFEAQASVRIQPNMRAIGQAAGTAATICSKEGIKPRELDGKRLRAVLRSQGAYL